MSRTRNDAGAVKRRREGALVRLYANRNRGYHGSSIRKGQEYSHPSDKHDVEVQIQRLERKLTLEF